MRYEEEIKILDSLGRGRKGRISRTRVVTTQAKQADSVGYIKRPVSSMLRTATGKTQAIFKITSYGKGRNKVANHLSYISRNGKLDLENEVGEKVIGRRGQRDVLNAWQTEFGNNKRSRDTVHIVLSTPPGTSREGAENAAREFLANEFRDQGHEYLFVAHKDTQHPHIHAVVKMQSIHGYKLNPRKAELHLWRERFAKICRAHGIDVEASLRCERGLSGPSPKSEFVQMKRAKRQPKVDKVLIEKVKVERQTKYKAHPSELKSLKRNQIIRKRYADLAKALMQKSTNSTNQKEKNQYQQAAIVLDNYAKKMPIEMNRGDKLHQQIDQKLKGLTDQSQAKLQTLRTVNQYLAVTRGKQSEEGIYKSPVEETVSTTMKFEQQLSETQVKQSIEIDFDD